VSIESSLRSVLDRRATALLKRTRDLQVLPQVMLMAQRLEAAIEADSEVDDTPVCIALLGGTGVGKSALFNALLENPNASPSSNAERGFTRQPYVAVHPEDRHSLLFDDCLDPVFVPATTRNTALIDTPDVDSVEEDNRKRTRIVMEMADVIIYVTSPDKRANFTVDKELREWASRKRWFFVMNKVDTLNTPLPAVRSDFCTRIEALGFSADDNICFLVSATHTGEYDFGRLKSAILSSRSVEQSRALREEGLFRRYAHAVTNEVVDPLHELLHSVDSELKQSNRQTRAVYRDVLSSRQTQRQIQYIGRELIWQNLPGRISGPLALPIRIRARLSRIGLALNPVRTTSDTQSQTRTKRRSGWQVITSAFRNTLPLQGLLAEFSPAHRQILNEIRTDAIRTVEDIGLTSEESQVDNTHDELLTLLGNRLLYSAQHKADSAACWHIRFFANLLPWVIILQMFWRLAQIWFAGEWLPPGFFLSAIVMLIVSMIPGWLLICAAVRRGFRKPDALIEEVIGEIKVPAETRPLQKVATALTKLKRNIATFNKSLAAAHKVLARELDPRHFGTPTNSA